MSRKIKILRSKNGPFLWLPKELPRSIVSTIDKATSYEEVGYQYTKAWAEGAWDGVTHLLKKSTSGAHYFPEGLLSRVEGILKIFGYEVEYELRHKPSKILRPKWCGPELREYQKNIVNQTMERLNSGRGCILNLPTGAGKTLCALRIITDLGVPTLILVHNKELMRQWKKQIETITKLRVGIYGGGEKNKDMMITIGMLQTLAKECKMTKKLNLNKFDLLIADECHHMSAPTFESVAAKCNSFYRIGLSATTKREDGAELKFVGGIGPIIQPVDTKFLIKEGYLTQPKLQLIRPPAPAKGGKDYNTEYTSGIVLNDGRNRQIALTAKKYRDEGKQVYINVRIKDHGKRLAEMIGCNFICSTSRNREREIESFATGNTRVLVSTLLGEGVDIPGIDVIIMASAGKSVTATIQKAGRVLRTKKGKKEAIIVDFADSGKYLRDHFNKRREAYREILGV